MGTSLCFIKTKIEARQTNWKHVGFCRSYFDAVGSGRKVETFLLRSAPLCTYSQLQGVTSSGRLLQGSTSKRNVITTRYILIVNTLLSILWCVNDAFHALFKIITQLSISLACSHSQIHHKAAITRFCSSQAGTNYDVSEDRRSVSSADELLTASLEQPSISCLWASYIIILLINTGLYSCTYL